VLFPFSIGGSEIRNYEIGKRLVKRGYEVHIFGIKYWQGEPIIEQEGIILHGVHDNKDIYNKKGKRKALSTVILSIKIFSELIKYRFDILDVQSFVFTHCYVAKVISFMYGDKLILTWHQYFGSYLFKYFGIFKGTAAFFLELFSVRLTHHNVIVSEHTRSQLTRHGVHKNDIVLIENGVDMEKISSVPEQVKIYDLLFVGRLNFQKNLSLLIDTVSEIKKKNHQIKVCIVGEGDEKTGMLKKIHEKGLTDNFVFKNFETDRKKIYSYIKQSKILILTSILEGLPLVLIEANACGVPVVSTKTAWNNTIDFLGREPVSGLATSPDASELSKEIMSLLDDKVRLEQFSKNALDKAKKYDWEIMTDKTESFYKSVLNIDHFGGKY
jgi:glycosyltransferase involved in cell wall biosynthesis